MFFIYILLKLNWRDLVVQLGVRVNCYYIVWKFFNIRYYWLEGES